MRAEAGACMMALATEPRFVVLHGQDITAVAHRYHPTISPRTGYVVSACERQFEAARVCVARLSKTLCGNCARGNRLSDEFSRDGEA